MKDSTKTLSVHFQDEIDSEDYQFQAGVNLLDFLNAQKVNINQSCGGSGTCTTCRVLVNHTDSPLDEMNEIESERSIERQFKTYERLACQVEIKDNLTITIPATNNYST